MASRLDAGKLELLKEEILIPRLYQTLSDRYQALASRSNCSLTMEEVEELKVYGDRNAIETVLGNLIENAIKYASGSPIRLSCKKQGDEVVLGIEDEGPGIPEDESGNVFRKFYRAESEETRSQKGSGLGLYIVRELIDLHGGRVELLSKTPKGAQFLIYLKQSNA